MLNLKNAKIVQNLSLLEQRLKYQQSYQEFTETVLSIKKLKPKRFYYIAVFLFTLGFTLLFISFIDIHFIVCGLCVFILSLFGVFYYGWLFVAISSKLDDISAEIYQKWGLLDLNLHCMPIKNGYVSSIINDFEELKRGNDSRTITLEYQSIDNNNKKFYFYEGEFIERDLATKKEVYTHYRCGMIFHFPPRFKNIFIISEGKTPYKIPYKLALHQFNQQFSLGAQDQHQLAKFLKPSIVEAILNLSDNFIHLNIEINAKGMICISSDDSDALIYTADSNINSPDVFLDELNKTTYKLPKVYQYIELYNILLKYSEDNF
ncbi:hypothetical protein [Proteus sp. ZN5]|uniref:hypothetical protein n=1 Tax=Proteus sp. ZN5 TaxID=2697019 RepID=UPI0013E1B18C|nr:hypothetical protein [Proteus sp. ZN5]QIG06054.1 hypothetical protein GTK47_12245 [Proteus sp. ZN5]